MQRNYIYIHQQYKHKYILAGLHKFNTVQMFGVSKIFLNVFKKKSLMLA